MDKRETQLCNMYTYITFYAKLYSLLGWGRLYEARISYPADNSKISNMSHEFIEQAN